MSVIIRPGHISEGDYKQMVIVKGLEGSGIVALCVDTRHEEVRCPPEQRGNENQFFGVTRERSESQLVELNADGINATLNFGTKLNPKHYRVHIPWFAIHGVVILPGQHSYGFTQKVFTPPTTPTVT